MLRFDPPTSVAYSRDTRVRRTALLIGLAWMVLACFGLNWGPAWGQEPDAEPVDNPPGGMEMPTSSDADALMDRAQELAAAGRFRECIGVLEHVSQAYGDKWTYQRDGVYRPSRLAVRRLIATWATDNPQAFAAYRIMADARVEAMLGQNPSASRDEAKLRAVIERYLLSSHGDEAALALGGLLMDRQAYGEAVAVLRTLVGEDRLHPDPSVDMGAVWWRLGMAAASLGDQAWAAEAIAALKNVQAPAGQIEAIQQRLAAVGPAGPSAAELAGRGPMPTLEAAPGRGDDDATGWGVLWEAGSGREHVDLAAALLEEGSTARHLSRPLMIRRWRASPWRPTTMARVVGDRLLFRAGVELVCVDRTTGRRLWTTDLVPQRQETAAVASPRAEPLGVRPSGPDEILLFGDRLSQQFTVSADGNRAYLIRPLTSAIQEDGLIGVGRIVRIRAPHYRIGPDYALPGNELVAVDLTTGAPLWRRAVAPYDENAQPTQLFAAPMVLGDRLYTILDDYFVRGRREASLAALNPRNGKVLWRQPLGRIELIDLSPEAPIRLASDGANIYISTGRGVVVAADVYTGHVRWALPYSRQHILPPTKRCLVQPAWAKNSVTIVGDTLVVTAADAEALMFIDRKTGRMRAALPGDADTPSVEQMDYLIGEMDGRVYIGGPNEVHCFKVDEARHLWTASWSPWFDETACTGRAVLTPDAIFVPVDRHIVQLDPATGEHLGEPVAAIGLGGEPIGNLLSDGEQLFDVAMDRARAVVSVPTLLARLDQQIAEGDAGARRRRAETWDCLDQPHKALADRRAAFGQMPEGPDRAALREKLFTSLLQQVRRAPKADDAGQLLEQAAQLAGRPEQETLVQLVRADWLAASDRRAEAVERYRQIAMDGAEILISPEADWPGWRVAAAALAADRLGRLVNGEGGAALIESLQTAGKAAMAKLGQTPAINDLARIARAHPGTAAAQDAIARIGAIGAQSGDKRFAPAELALRQLAGAGVGPNAQAARDELAAMYLARGWAHEAATVLDPHRQRFGAGPATEGAEAGKADERRDGERLADPPLKRLTVADTHVQPLQLTCGAALNHSPFLRDHLFVYQRGEQRIARLNPRQQFKSEARLDLPDDATGLFERWHGRLCGGLDGHVMVVLTPGRMVAWDVMAGRALWEAAPPSGQRQIIAYHPGRRGPPTGYVKQTRQPSDSHDVHGGMVVELLTVPDSFERQVVARDLLTGRVLWRHRPEDKVFHGVHLFGQHAVITAGARGERLLVLDQGTGQPLGEHALSELFSAASFFPGPHGLVYQTVWNASSPTKPRGSGHIEFGLVPFDDKAQPWKRTLSRIHAVNTRYALVLPDEDDFITELVDLRTGKTLWKNKDERISSYLGHHDLGPQTDRLVLLTRKRGRRAGFLLQEVKLTTGEPIRQISFSYRHYGYYNMRMLARSGPYMAFTGLNNKRLPAKLWFFRRADGKPARIEVRGSLSVGRPMRPCIRGNALIVPHSQGIVAFVEDDQPDAADEK